MSCNHEFQSFYAFTVICMTFVQEETSVVSSGVDPILVQFDCTASSLSTDSHMWVKSVIRKNHSHDVRAVVFTRHSVITGGKHPANLLPAVIILDKFTGCLMQVWTVVWPWSCLQITEFTNWLPCPTSHWCAVPVVSRCCCFSMKATLSSGNLDPPPHPQVCSQIQSVYV